MAKKEHTKYAASQRQTGGGKKPASPVSATKKIIDLFGEDPAFSGIVGGVKSASTTSTSTVEETSCLILTEPGPSSTTEPLQCTLPQALFDGDSDGHDSSMVQLQKPVLLKDPMPECQILTVPASQKAPGNKKKKEGDQ